MSEGIKVSDMSIAVIKPEDLTPGSVLVFTMESGVKMTEQQQEEMTERLNAVFPKDVYPGVRRCLLQGCTVRVFKPKA